MLVSTVPLLFGTALSSSSLSLANRLDEILDRPQMEGAVIGALVVDDCGTPLYQRNPNLRLVPASNQKLLTCAFALHRLGADWRPKTRFWRVGNAVYVDAVGDPSIESTQLLNALRSRKLLGTSTVMLKQAYEGGIPPGWEHDDLPNRYAAPVFAFSVDRGAFELWNVRGTLRLLPRNYGVRIVRHRRMGSLRVKYQPSDRVIHVFGAVSREENRMVDSLAIDRPDRCAASLIGRRLKLATSVPTSPPAWILEGPPLSELMTQCLVRSDNHFAEQLLLMSSDVTGEQPWPAATRELKKFLVESVGMNAKWVEPTDGSGLSRHSFVTPTAVVKLLQWAKIQPTASVWRQALVVPGKGTLTNRLAGVDFAGKTGTLNRVVSLSGYVRQKDGSDLTASLILNHFACSQTEARDIADDFVRAVSSEGFLNNASGTNLAAKRRHEGRFAQSGAPDPYGHRIR
jgi:D-alanyl-D-alanine carboxypeptidase/D-alanyl-D-alanine-endopeptidase (penicillin-binding protein 4)